MSTRAIAPIVGASHMTVSNDLSAVKTFTAEPSAPVQGVDGKTYTRPDPKPEPGDGTEKPGTNNRCRGSSYGTTQIQARAATSVVVSRVLM
jgi:hypothetical protein